jgi:hypothetical protein
MAALVRHESAMEYFKELVDSAIAHQGVEAGEDTAFYVVNLLAGFAGTATGPWGSADPGSTQSQSVHDEPLAIVLTRALASGGSRQRSELRRVGDLSLFVSGFFSDSLNRSLVDVDYYATLGGYAYGSLSRVERDTVASVFAELAQKFAAFVDVLTEVSERSSIASNSDLLRLYEKWLRTGSRRNGDLLVRRGIVPNASVGSRFVQ